MNKLLTLILIPLFFTNNAFSKIQNEDVKSISDIESSVLSTTGNVSSSSTPTCITSLSSTANVAAGQFVYDTTHSYIPASTTVLGIGTGPCSAGQVQMSASSTGTATGDTITFGGQQSQSINTSKIYDVTYTGQLSTLISNSGLGALATAASGSAMTSNGSGTATWQPVLSNPMTAGGQMIGGGTSGVATTIAAGTSGQVIMSNGSSVSSFNTVPGNSTILKFPAITTYITSGGASGTYTVPTSPSPLYIIVEMVGPGSGGSGSGASGTASQAGNQSTIFGINHSNLLVATSGAATANEFNSGAGGTTTVNSPAVQISVSVGGQGSAGTDSSGTPQTLGGAGGATPFGAGGGGGTGLTGALTGVANSGAGGGGAGAAGPSGAGGSGGGYLKAMITQTNLQTTYTWQLGSGGAGGTGTLTGGSGSDGKIIITAYYQ
jgi:hypothetical protein